MKPASSRLKEARTRQVAEFVPRLMWGCPGRDGHRLLEKCQESQSSGRDEGSEDAKGGARGVF